MKPRRSILPGVVFILLGVFLLGLVNGWWHFDWRYLVVFWPVVLIAIGLRLLLPPAAWAGWLILALVIAAVAGLTSAPASWRDPLLNRIAGHAPDAARTASVSQSGGADVNTLKLELDLAASDARLTALPADSSLLYTAATHGAGLNQSFKRTADTATASLEISASDWMMMSHRTLDVALSRHPALDLTLNSGAASSNLDLSELNLARLNLDGGASHTTLKLGGRSAHQTVSIDGGASHLTIRVPTTAALHITRSGGLTSDNFDTLGLARDGDTYTSSGYDTAPLQISLSFDGGVSSLTIERY